MVMIVTLTVICALCSLSVAASESGSPELGEPPTAAAEEERELDSGPPPNNEGGSANGDIGSNREASADIDALSEDVHALRIYADLLIYIGIPIFFAYVFIKCIISPFASMRSDDF